MSRKAICTLGDRPRKLIGLEISPPLDLTADSLNLSFASNLSRPQLLCRSRWCTVCGWVGPVHTARQLCSVSAAASRRAAPVGAHFASDRPRIGDELRFLVADALLSPQTLRLGAPGEKPRSRRPQNHHPRMDEASQRQTRFKRTGAVICDPSCRTARAKGARRFGRADRELVGVAHRQELTAAASGRRYQPRKQQPLSRCSKLPTRPHHL
jgi:hypothetical protein